MIMKICSSCIPYLCALDVPLRTCEASHGGKHCDSVGEDQICYRSEFARAEGMVVAQQPVLFFVCGFGSVFASAFDFGSALGDIFHSLDLLRRNRPKPSRSQKPKQRLNRSQLNQRKHRLHQLPWQMEAIWTQRLLPLATWIEIGMEIDKQKSENNEVMKLIALDK